MVVDTKTDKQKLQESTWEHYVLAREKPNDSVQKFVGSFDPKLSLEETAHIVHCIDAAMQELCGICRCGRFGKAVLANNLREAVGYADDTNSKWLKIYVSWFYNEVPSRLLDFYRNS